MKSFAQNMARIEEILELMRCVAGGRWSALHAELRDVLDDEAENIVALGKAAARMRNNIHVFEAGSIGEYSGFYGARVHNEEEVVQAIQAYDKLFMTNKGEE